MLKLKWQRHNCKQNWQSQFKEHTLVIWDGLEYVQVIRGHHSERFPNLKEAVNFISENPFPKG